MPDTTYEEDEGFHKFYGDHPELFELSDKVLGELYDDEDSYAKMVKAGWAGICDGCGRPLDQEEST